MTEPEGDDLTGVLWLLWVVSGLGWALLLCLLVSR